MVSEKEIKNRTDLFRLMQENPDAPILPIVQGSIAYISLDAPYTDYGHWYGSPEKVFVDEYVIPKEAGGILFKSDNEDKHITVARYLGAEGYDALKTNDECMEYYDNKIPWAR